LYGFVLSSLSAAPGVGRLQCTYGLAQSVSFRSSLTAHVGTHSLYNYDLAQRIGCFSFTENVRVELLALHILWSTTVKALRSLKSAKTMRMVIIYITLKNQIAMHTHTNVSETDQWQLRMAGLARRYLFLVLNSVTVINVTYMDSDRLTYSPRCPVLRVPSVDPFLNCRTQSLYLSAQNTSCA
jgi:hypothetical protein